MSEGVSGDQLLTLDPVEEVTLPDVEASSKPLKIWIREKVQAGGTFLLPVYCGAGPSHLIFSCPWTGVHTVSPLVLRPLDLDWSTPQRLAAGRSCGLSASRILCADSSQSISRHGALLRSLETWAPTEQEGGWRRWGDHASRHGGRSQGWGPTSAPSSRASWPQASCRCSFLICNQLASGPAHTGPFSWNPCPKYLQI